VTVTLTVSLYIRSSGNT